MDSTLTLALMMKAKIVFERGTDFLSFPLTPISYDPNDFAYLFDALPTPVDLTNLSAFSALADMIPDGIEWPPERPNALSDAYGNVLRTAALAPSTRTADEEQQYEAANAVLYVSNADGTRTPTPALQAYDQYRDAYIVAEQNYATAKNTAETSSDPAVAAQWTAQGPPLQQAVDDASNAWNEQGYKAEIETARGVADRLGAKSPEIEWQRWTSAFDPNISGLTDPSGARFYPAAPSPANVFEAGAVWQQFTLLGDEADALVKQAPADLKTRFAAQSLDVALQKLTFEYASVLVKRAWFDPQIFNERYWRFSDGHALSDGSSLATGDCPAYVYALVLVRNVQIQLAPDPVRNGPILTHLQSGPLNIGFFTMHAVTATPLTLTAVPRTFTPAFTPVRAEVEAPVVHAPVAVAAPVAAAPAVAAPAVMRMPATVAQAQLVRRIMPPIFIPHGTGTTSPPPPPPPQPATDPATMYVLGFLCRHVPAAPNPDLTLTWS